MTRPTQGVILCGGLGTRLRPHTDNLPKPLIPCNGFPFLWYLLQQLHEQGINQFVLLTGFLGEQIEGYFGDGSTWGWQIQYSMGPVEWDTGKRIWEARKKIDECFLLLYSDNFVPYPLDKLIALHNRNGKALTFMVSAKSPGNIMLDEAGIVQKYDNDRSNKELNYVEIGYMIAVKEQVLDYYETPACSFSSILRKMAAQRNISAWVQQDSYHSISDPIRWKKTEEYLKPKKIILIDRDGVINQKAPRGEYISTWQDFELIPETHDVLKTLAQEGFQFILISNQAGIARGMVDQDELNLIHSNLKKEFEKGGIEILDIYVCPHHWEENCGCRKPKPGMFYQASRDWLLRLDKTLFIGDDPRDCQAAYEAGCQSVFVGDKIELQVLSELEQPTCASKNLYDCLPIILEYFNQNNIYDYH